jgi:hypothetical protein
VDNELLTHLIDLALDVMVLPDFQTRLQGLVAESTT